MPPCSTSMVRRSRAGVEGVLDELLDYGCRALDDLARSDLVDERALEDPDGHGVTTAAPV